MKKIAYLNGKFVEQGLSHLSLRDLGLLRGYGVFDVSRVFSGTVFCHKEHWDRLVNGAHTLGFALPLDQPRHQEVIHTLLQYNNKTNTDPIAVRTIITGGVSEGGFLPEGEETFVVMLEDVHTPPDTIYQNGAQLQTLEYKRDFPWVKTTQYIMPISYRRQHPGGKDVFELLYTWQGKVLEASTSNISIVKNNTIISPRENILGGITRLVALRIAREMDIRVFERDITLEEFFDADEVFLTASNKKIVPIVAVDNKKIAKGISGKITLRLLREYEKITEGKR